MSNFAEIIVKELLDDEYFVNDCKKELNEIMKDGKFDTNDLPELMQIVVLIFEKYDTFDIEEDDIIKVFRLLIVELIKKIGSLEESNPQFDKMIDSCLKLLVLKVKTTKIHKKYFSCCFYPKKMNTHIVDNINNTSLEIVEDDNTLHELSEDIEIEMFEKEVFEEVSEEVLDTLSNEKEPKKQ